MNNMNRQNKKYLFNVMGACIFAIILTAAFCLIYYLCSDTDNRLIDMITADSKYDFKTTKVTSGNIEAISDVSEVVEKVMPSVVSITEKRVATVYDYWFGYGSQQESSGSGSGFIIGEDKDNYYIATNNHVVANADSIEVTFIDEKLVSATVKGTDASNDLAILAVAKKSVTDSTKKKIKVASVGDSDELRVGENVIAIGNALGYGQSVTVGYVSAKDRKLEFTDGSMTAIQTDAAINPGNSGGALINTKGEVIGINSAKLASTEVEGMGYAIPISKAQPILDKLIKKEKVNEKDKGYLGITIRDISEEEKEILSYPEGVYVDAVGEKGGAYKAGVKAGDIIVKFDGEKVKTADALLSLAEEHKKGDTVAVEIKRLNKGKYKDIVLDVTLTEQVLEENEIKNEFQ